MMNSTDFGFLSREALLTRFGCPRDETVIFTNGCFDLLHHGHVRYLERAREFGGFSSRRSQLRCVR